MYVCPTSAHRGFRYGYRRYKGNTFTLKTTLFGWQSMALRSDLTLLNINMSKNSTFAWFFLPKSLYYQWLFVSLQRQSSPSLLTMLKSCEAFFVYTHLNMASLIPFTKRFESSENLVDLLESRGLQICDRNKAIQYLDNIGYYRLSAYMYPLLKMPKTAHLYKEGSTFKKVMMLYRFDKKLRLLMFNEIEKIEIAIRRAVMQITADMTGNPFWLTDSSYFLDSSKFNETMRAISKEYSKSKEEFILHFKRTYSEPYPPSWILGELLTIGNINAIYRNIKQNRIRKRIAKRFGLPINVFESWLTVIAVTRNACGHHSRVWNKQNAIQPAIPNSPAGEWITQPTDSMRAYFDLCIIKYFLNVISPNNNMQSKLTWLFIRFPEIDLQALGFPQGWEMEPLWR